MELSKKLVHYCFADCEVAVLFYPKHDIIGDQQLVGFLSQVQVKLELMAYFLWYFLDEGGLQSYHCGMGLGCDLHPIFLQILGVKGDKADLATLILDNKAVSLDHEIDGLPNLLSAAL